MASETYTFHTWEDLLEAVTPLDVGSAFIWTSSVSGNKYFTGTDTYKEALTLAHSGWLGPIDTIDRIAAHVEDRIDTQVFGTDFVATYGVAGAQVDIGRYCAGEPECMVEAEPIRVSRQGRAVRLLIPVTYNAVVTESAIQGYGAAAVALADLLARAQHPLEVWIDYGAGEVGGRETFHCQTRVQRADEPLDVGRLTYAVCHPASLRRLGFRAVENLVRSPELARALGSGYGRSVDADPKALPDQVENTIQLPHLSGNEWAKEEHCAQWVEEQLHRIFD